MRTLVVAAEPVAPNVLRAALASVPLEEAELRVVAPALNDSALAFWASDSDAAIAASEQAAEATAGAARQAGARAGAHTGESDPLAAVEDALRTFPAEQTLGFRHSPAEAAYPEDELDPQALEDRFGLPAVAQPVARG